MEAVLLACPLVRAAAARAWPAPKLAGLRLVAYFEAADAAACSGSALEREAMRWCRNRLPEFSTPSSISTLPRLPRSSAGKILRASLPQPTWAAAGVGAAAGVDTTAASAGPSLGGRPPIRSPSRPPLPVAGRPPSQPSPPFAAVSEARVMEAFAAALGAAPSPTPAATTAAAAGTSRGLEPTADFFAVSGGDSMAAAAAAAALGIEPGLVVAFPTARSLARHLSGNPAPTAAAVAAPRATAPPLLLPESAPPVSPAALEGLIPDPSVGGVVYSRCGGVTRVDPLSGTLPVSQGGEASLATSLIAPEDAVNGQSGQGYGTGFPAEIKCLWRVRLAECVDASVVVLEQPGVGGGSAEPARQFIFACSHGGTVVCLDGESGIKVQLRIPS